MLCEQTGEEPDPDKIPPEIEDFPDDVQNAIIVYNKLGDKLVPDIGYLGKDLTSLPIHMEIINPYSKEIFLETILRLDQRQIEKSQQAMKQERDKLKSKMKK